jgi:hypothetical protein
MTAANLSDLLAGHVAISYRNLPRLLNGFESRKDRLAFLVAHLRDMVPPDYEDDIVIKTKSRRMAGTPVSEDEITKAWQHLPGRELQTRIIRLLKALAEDEDFRELFMKMMDYVR